MEYQDLIDWICFLNLEIVEYYDDQLLDKILEAAEDTDNPFQYVAITKCGATVENCRLIFNVNELMEGSKDIEDVIEYLDNLNYVEFSFWINGDIGHEFVIVKHNDVYLIIQSFIVSYTPKVTIVGIKELVQFLDDLADIQSREKMLRWINVDIGDLEVTDSELFVRVPAQVVIV